MLTVLKINQWLIYTNTKQAYLLMWPNMLIFTYCTLIHLLTRVGLIHENSWGTLSGTRDVFPHSKHSGLKCFEHTFVFDVICMSRSGGTLHRINMCSIEHITPHHVTELAFINLTIWGRVTVRQVTVTVTVTLTLQGMWAFTLNWNLGKIWWVLLLK